MEQKVQEMQTRSHWVKKSADEQTELSVFSSKYFLGHTSSLLHVETNSIFLINNLHLEASMQNMSGEKARHNVLSIFKDNIQL